ncbi:hypothetical protein IA69_03250 [Massilia sp. JS1662]|nr:hypothetical protein IA69_03250 [Massilia sp. JS1662]
MIRLDGKGAQGYVQLRTKAQWAALLRHKVEGRVQERRAYTVGVNYLSDVSFMLTSNHSNWAAQAVTLCVALLTASHVHAAEDHVIRRATAAEVEGIKARTASTFKDHDDFPVEPTATLKSERPLYWSARQGGRLLALFTLRYKGAAHGYCRLVTVENEQRDPDLIDLPMDMNADNCRGFRDVRYLDINGDGKLDVAASMTVKANSFDGDVDQPVVYLSNADKPGGYCYSATASRNLQPAVMGSAGKVKQALDRERKRLGVAQFDCTP